MIGLRPPPLSQPFLFWTAARVGEIYKSYNHVSHVNITKFIYIVFLNLDLASGK